MMGDAAAVVGDPHQHLSVGRRPQTDLDLRRAPAYFTALSIKLRKMTSKSIRRPKTRLG